MKNCLFLYFIFSIFFGYSQSNEQSIDLITLRKSNNGSKPFRVLMTTISDQSLFQKKYNGTDMTLEFVLRHHFYTAIDLNADKNQLISMDGTKFILSSNNAKDITDESILLVSKMYFGKKEFKTFKNIIKKNEEF